MANMACYQCDHSIDDHGQQGCVRCSPYCQLLASDVAYYTTITGLLAFSEDVLSSLGSAADAIANAESDLRYHIGKVEDVLMLVEGD